EYGALREHRAVPRLGVAARRPCARGHLLVLHRGHKAHRRGGRRGGREEGRGRPARGSNQMTLNVGIIGAGRIGQAMAQTALRAGRRGVIANSRAPESLTSVVEALGDGVSAGTVEDAAAADIVVVAVMWGQVPQALEGLEWEGRKVIGPAKHCGPRDLGGPT